MDRIWQLAVDLGEHGVYVNNMQGLIGNLQWLSST